MTWIMEEIIVLPFSFHCVLNYPVSALSLLISKAPVFSISPLMLFIFILSSYPNATMMWPPTRCSQGHMETAYFCISDISLRVVDRKPEHLRKLWCTYHSTLFCTAEPFETKNLMTNVRLSFFLTIVFLKLRSGNSPDFFCLSLCLLTD